MDISIIVPIYNERESIGTLFAEIASTLDSLALDYEVIFVDDGSKDGSVQQLRSLAMREQCVKVVELRRNFGQTAALQAGLEYAKGDAIVTMDGDLQNDPADIPMMLAKLNEGYDLVHGWRQNRQDHWLNRRLPSKIANWLIAKTTHFPVHDLGCTLKVIRRDVADELELYGEMHRFIPILAYQRGARCAEIVTRHRARQFGETKYGIGRTLRVLLDLITVKFLLDYFASPMKLFGRFGLWSLAVSIVCMALTTCMKLASGIDMTGNPLLLLGVGLGVVSVQFFSLGLLGEVSARIYYALQGNQQYAVRRVNESARASDIENAVQRTPSHPVQSEETKSTAIVENGWKQAG